VKISELKKGVDKGSQKRATHPTATDDPDKYIGKWEAYDEPQGIGSPAGKEVTKNTSVVKSSKGKKTEAASPFGSLTSPGRVARGGIEAGTWQHSATLDDLNPDSPSANPHKRVPMKNNKAPLVATKKKVRKLNTNSVREGLIFEYIRKPQPNDFSADYEVRDDIGEELLGFARVTKGVIELLSAKDTLQEDYSGHVYTQLLGTIIRDADDSNANLSILLARENDLSFMRFMERFGFRHIGEGIMKRNAGAIKPPGVPMGSNGIF